MRLPAEVRTLVLWLVGVLSPCVLPAAAVGGQADDPQHTEPNGFDLRKSQDFLRLWKAVHDNDPAAVNAALDAGVNVNAKSPHDLYLQPGLTALHFAAEVQALAAAEALLARGADANATDPRRRTPLHYVIAERLIVPHSPQHREQATRFAELLLRHQADINCEDLLGFTPLHMTAQSYQASRETVEWLKAKGARFDIFVAAGLGDAERVTELLADSPELARRTLKGADTPLHFAGWSGRLRVAEALVEAGADVEVRNSRGETPLCAAFGELRGQSEIVALLLARTRNLNVRDNEGRTPLHHAAKGHWTSRTNIPEQLLAKGAPVNARDDYGLTPLHYAAYYAANKELCALLLEHGAELHAKSDDGQTAESLVRMHPENRELNAYFDELLKKQPVESP